MQGILSSEQGACFPRCSILRRLPSAAPSKAPAFLEAACSGASRPHPRRQRHAQFNEDRLADRFQEEASTRRQLVLLLVLDDAVAVRPWTTSPGTITFRVWRRAQVVTRKDDEGLTNGSA